jgi:hypothetical protein
MNPRAMRGAVLPSVTIASVCAIVRAEARIYGWVTEGGEGGGTSTPGGTRRSALCRQLSDLRTHTLTTASLPE